MVGGTLGCLVSYSALGTHTITKFDSIKNVLVDQEIEVPAIATLCSSTFTNFANMAREIPIPCDATGYYGQMFIAEVVGTFIFVGLILSIKYHNTAKDDLVNGIGVCICLAAMVKVLGPISGACLNPAVGICQTFFQQAVFAGLNNVPAYSTRGIGVYVFGPLFGGIFAGIYSLFRKFSLDKMAESADKSKSPYDAPLMEEEM